MKATFAVIHHPDLLLLAGADAAIDLVKAGLPNGRAPNFYLSTRWTAAAPKKGSTITLPPTLPFIEALASGGRSTRKTRPAYDFSETRLCRVHLLSSDRSRGKVWERCQANTVFGIVLAAFQMTSSSG